MDAILAIEQKGGKNGNQGSNWNRISSSEDKVVNCFSRAQQPYSNWDNTALRKLAHYTGKYIVYTAYYTEVYYQNNPNWDTALVLV